MECVVLKEEQYVRGLDDEWPVSEFGALTHNTPSGGVGGSGTAHDQATTAPSWSAITSPKPFVKKTTATSLVCPSARAHQCRPVLWAELAAADPVLVRRQRLAVNCENLIAVRHRPSAPTRSAKADEKTVEIHLEHSHLRATTETLERRHQAWHARRHSQLATAVIGKRVVLGRVH